MFWGKRKRLLADAIAAQGAAMEGFNEFVENLRLNSAVNKHAGGVELNDADQDKLSEITANMMIAQENIMAAAGRAPMFNIRPLYPPLDPAGAKDLSRRVKRLLFPK